MTYRPPVAVEIRGGERADTDRHRRQHPFRRGREDATPSESNLDAVRTRTGLRETSWSPSASASKVRDHWGHRLGRHSEHAASPRLPPRRPRAPARPMCPDPASSLPSPSRSLGPRGATAIERHRQERLAIRPVASSRGRRMRSALGRNSENSTTAMALRRFTWGGTSGSVGIASFAGRSVVCTSHRHDTVTCGSAFKACRSAGSVAGTAAAPAHLRSMEVSRQNAAPTPNRFERFPQGEIALARDAAATRSLRSRSWKIRGRDRHRHRVAERRAEAHAHSPRPHAAPAFSNCRSRHLEREVSSEHRTLARSRWRSAGSRRRRSSAQIDIVYSRIMPLVTCKSVPSLS
jgi:hypothetical protein